MAGSEAALQLAARGVAVRLCEMRPTQMTAAHHGGDLAELVCSNSFRGADLANAAGLLKEEMRRAGGVLMRLAEAAAVPAGGALAVDRERFAAAVSAAVAAEPLIERVDTEVRELPAGPTLIATGPLTSDALAAAIVEATGTGRLFFYDSIAPIIDSDSINRDTVYALSRYGKGEGNEYLNCPLTEAQYVDMVERICSADLASAHEFEDAKFFEACLPIEVMAGRGLDTLRFGPMKPVGLPDPRTGEIPWAVVQLRMENREGTAWNMVGFQTRMKWGAQKEIFRSIPGLEDAEFLRFGSVHRNTFIHGPSLLTERLQLRETPDIRFAGQITGVEGYIESMATGMIAGILMAGEVTGLDVGVPPAETALGALCRHVSGQLHAEGAEYQPSNVNWGMFPRMSGRKIRRRRMRRLATAERALTTLDEWLEGLDGLGMRVPGFRKHEPDDGLRDE